MQVLLLQANRFTALRPALDSTISPLSRFFTTAARQDASPFTVWHRAHKVLLRKLLAHRVHCRE